MKGTVRVIVLDAEGVLVNGGRTLAVEEEVGLLDRGAVPVDVRVFELECVNLAVAVGDFVEYDETVLNGVEVVVADRFVVQDPVDVLEEEDVSFLDMVRSEVDDAVLEGAIVLV